MKTMQQVIAEADAVLNQVDATLDAWIGQTRAADAVRDAESALRLLRPSPFADAIGAWVAALHAGRPADEVIALGNAAIAIGRAANRALAQQLGQEAA